MNLINMRRITIISFLKLFISYLFGYHSSGSFSGAEAKSLPEKGKPHYLTQFLAAWALVFILGFAGMDNSAYGQACNPALTGCPGDIVVNVQPNTCGNNVTWTAPSMITPCPGYTVTSNHAPGDFFNSGTTQVIYFSWFGTEKKDSCKFNVIVVDNQKPVIATKNADLYINQSGTAILNTSDIDNGSSDNCSLTLIPGRTIFSCSDVGLTIPVVLTGTDPSGNSSSSTAQVTIHDTTRPVINTREFSLILDNNGTGSINASDIDNGTYDNCGPVTLSVTPSDFSCADQGAKKITFTASDSHGNIATRDVWISVNSSLKINSISLSNCDAAGTYALFNSNVSGGSGTYFYFWDCLNDAVYPFVQEIAVYPFVTFVNTSTKITPFFNNNIPDGNYTIRLIITDGNGCRDTAEMVIVKTGPVYSNITRRSSTACEGSKLTYTVNPDPVATFDWEVTNGTILSSPPFTNSVDIQWDLGVTYGVVTATLNKTNLMGEPCSSTVIDSVSIDLIPPPVFNNPVINACLGSEETYTLTAPYQAYEWIVTGGLVTGGGSGNNFVKVRWNPLPSGKVTVIVSTTTGCSASAYIDVNINNLTGSILSVTDITCNGAANGMVSVSATAGTGVAPYEYSLDGGAYQSSGNFVNITPGPHFVRIRDAVLCTYDLGFNIIQPLVLVASVNKVDVTCYGGLTGAITAAGSGGTPPYEYSLNGTAFQPSGAFSGLPAGLHTLEVKDANGCSFVQKISLLQPDAVTGSAVITTPVNCFGGTATVTLTGTGGTAPLSYTFNGVTNSTGVFPGIPAGTSYSWSITDANNCGPFTGTLEVTQPAALTGTASVTSAILCNGGTATVTITGSGGTSPLSYTFNGVTNASGVFSGIPAGPGYSWSITDSNGCGPVTGTLQVTEPPVITGSASVTVPVLCNGGTATVRLTGGGGTEPLSYTFNGVTNTSGIFSGIPAGTGYIWSITDANSCTPATGSIDVTQPDVITGSASVTAMILCHGGTATVRLTGGGGTAPLSYTFNGVTNASGIFTGIPAGTGYLWSITDANSCTPATGSIDVTEPVAISGSASVTTAITCNGGTATVTLTGTGGTAPLSYTFNGVTNSTGVFPGIPAGTSYSWSITDANNCGPFTGTLEVTQPAALTGTASVTSAILCNGGTATVTITGSGGTSPLSYTFNGVTNASGVFSGIPAGPGYSWSITDSNGCGPVTGTLQVTEPPVITGSASVTVPVLCNGGTATVRLTGGGGTEPLSYTFNGVTNTSGIFSGIPAGTGYIWSITDVSSCAPVTGIIDVNEPVAISGTASVTSEIICHGGTAIVTITGSGGTAPLSYTFNGLTNTTGIFPGITAGSSYSWSITDANYCGPLTGVLDVNQPDLLIASAEVINPVPCTGGTATVKITSSGGTAPYSFTFNGVTNATGLFSGIPAGNDYTWSINDVNNCGPVEGILDVIEPTVISGSATVTTPVPCNGGTATVTVISTGGTAPFTYAFNGVTNSTGIFSGIPPGTGYQWIINDVNGCPPATGTTDVTEPELISGSISITTPIICYGETTTVIITGSGGTAPLIYTFNGISNQTGIFTEIPAGSSYIWSISDVNNCTPVTGTIDITQPPEYIATITDQSNVTVIGGNDGSVTVEATGGTPPYLYRLNSGTYQPSGVFTDLTAGNYIVTVQDAALCELAVPVIITDPGVPLGVIPVSQQDILCFGESTGSLTVRGTGGTEPYEYSLDKINYQSSGTFTNLPAGSYTVTVRDARLDEAEMPATLSEPATAVSVSAYGINNLCHGDNSGKVIALASGGTSPYEYSWNTIPEQVNDTVTALSAGSYTVTVTDANGCKVVSEVMLTDPPALSLSISSTDADCPDTSDGSVTLTITGGSPPYNTSWNDEETSVSRTELLPGTYNVTVTDANGCEAEASATVGFAGTFGCVEIPQIITPNNDGYNDEWRIRNIDLYPDAEVLVYTRWGKLVYKSRNISADPWDGRFNGRLMPVDSYHYILYLNDGSKPRSGVISIIR